MSWKTVYRCGFICSLLFMAGIVLDIIVGNVTGGDVSALPRTAVDRYAEFRENPILGLYHLDLLNLLNQIILLPVFFALFAAHRRVNLPGAGLALVIFITGSAVFICNNTALSMLDLSRKFSLAESDSESLMLAAAGESLLARGAHGSLGAFTGFLLPTIGNLIMALVMFSGRIFSRTTAWLGISGTILMLLYMILVTFIPSSQRFAMVIAMPGGLLTLAWMMSYTIRLNKLTAEKD